MISNAVVFESYRPGLEQELVDLLRTVSTDSKFDDMIWFCDKLKLSEGHNDHDYKIYFEGIDEAYFEIIRHWALTRIKNLLSIRTVGTNVTMIKRFLSFITEEFGPMPLSDVSRITIEIYQEHLNADTTIQKSTKELTWTAIRSLFTDMLDWPGMPRKQVVPPGNPFNRRELDRKHAQRLVPDSVLAQLDKIFKRPEVPIEDRCLYWILRLIPSRIQELTIMPIECLRPYNKDWVLQLYDKKQSGSQYYAKKRMVHLKYQGMGKFLIDLIREQQAVAISLQDYLQEDKRGLLFTSCRRMLTVKKAPDMERLKAIKPYNHDELNKLTKHTSDSERGIVLLLWYEAYIRKLAKHNRSFPPTNQEIVNEALGPNFSRGILHTNPHIKICHDRHKPLVLILSDIKKYIAANIPKKDQIVWMRNKKETAYIITGPNARKRFKRNAQVYDVKGLDGKIFNFITHCLRHNGITERLYEGFSYVEIRDTTGHEGNQMIGQAYSHVKDEEIVKIARKRREKGESGPPVLFKGKIMNLDAKRAEHLLRRPRAYRIGDLGICSDITSCKNDLFECLECDYLVPDADCAEYYEHEVDKWTERSRKHRKNGNKMLAEQAEYMAVLHGKQLDRIRLGLAMAELEVANAD